MTNAIKDWLPITKRNRVALGFAFAALVMFVTWNFFPAYEMEMGDESGELIYARDGLVFMKLWPAIVDPDMYLHAVRSPSVDIFFIIAANIALLMNGLIVLVIVPLWKFLHVSNYLRVPIALVNLLGGMIVLRFFFENIFVEPIPIHEPMPYLSMMLLFIALTMLAVFFAMLIFKNELGLRHDLEVKKTMASGGLG